MFQPTHRHRVVIAGGGVAALEALLALNRIALRELEVLLVAPGSSFGYRPLAVSRVFEGESDIRLPLAELARRHGAEHRRCLVEAVDPYAAAVALSDGTAVAYDSLLLATGARSAEAVPGALTYRGDRDVKRIGDVLAAIRDGRVRRLAFVVPPGCGWPLPMYELALMTATWTAQLDHRVELVLVTAESTPLGLFGAEPSEAVVAAMAAAGIVIRPRSAATEFADGRLWLDLEGAVRVDRAIALPRPLGRAPEGLAVDDAGFLPVDDMCHVIGAPEGVFAAGDMTAGAVKQGGLATQQADVAAAAIARRAGLDVETTPYRPVLRGMLLTGDTPLYLRRSLDLGGELPALDHEPLWWPPHKIVGRELAPFLASNLDLACPDGPDSVAVDVALA